MSTCRKQSPYFLGQHTKLGEKFSLNPHQVQTIRSSNVTFGSKEKTTEHLTKRYERVLKASKKFSTRHTPEHYQEMLVFLVTSSGKDWQEINKPLEQEDSW